MKVPRTFLVFIALGALLYALFPALSNLWYLAIDTQDVYAIPNGSSLFTFRPTEMNSGSGDWWIYGQDERNYYYFENDIKVSKQATKVCQAFVANDYTTWCLSAQ
jgi:hypothetical protein